MAWDEDEAFAADSCDDGEDNDSDGWIDATDLDCTMYGEEVGFSTLFCNDGLDNDGDGLIDSNDMGCEDGFDFSEHDMTSTCMNGLDDE